MNKIIAITVSTNYSDLLEFIIKIIINIILL